MNLLREYIREFLAEKELRQHKKKRALYHIGPTPAVPKPMSRPYEQTWRRYWLDKPVETGVFFSPNPIDIAQYHGVSGNVYAYKIPEWVIAKAGGIHRYDHGSEVLISEELWEEAGSEIEFLGKSIAEKDLWDKIESLGSEPLRRSAGSRPGWMSDKEWERWSSSAQHTQYIKGLRATKHLESGIKMMKPAERTEALTAFEKEQSMGNSGTKDQEIVDLLKKFMNEVLIREYTEVPADEELHPSQMKTVGEIVDLIQRIQDEEDETSRKQRAKSVGIEFFKIAMGEIPLVGGTLGALDGLYAMYEAGKNEEHTWAEIEEYPILKRMKMHPDLVKHLDPITLKEVDKAYRDYLGGLGRETKVSSIRDIDVFARDWILADTSSHLDVELLENFLNSFTIV